MNELITNRLKQNYSLGFSTEIETDVFPKGLNEDIIIKISELKNEPSWFTEWRLKAYRHWLTLSEPKWANVKYPKIDYQDLAYYASPKVQTESKEIDPKLLELYEKLGVPLKEREILLGRANGSLGREIAVDAVLDSVSVGTTFKDKLEKVGVLFCSFSEALQKYPDIIKEYLGSVVSYKDNYFAALNSAVMSDGSFAYIPKGVKCPMELSTYFRINQANTGQFERTLIIAEEGAYVSYLEGCLPSNMEINTEEGWKYVSNVSIKDRVYDHKGDLQKVNAIMMRPYQGTMYHFHHENILSCTEEHPVAVFNVKGFKAQIDLYDTICQLHETNQDYILKHIIFKNAKDIQVGDFFISCLSALPNDVRESLEAKARLGDGNYFKIGEYFFSKVTDIEKETVDTLVFNLEVNDTNTYMVKNYITHNCSAPARSDNQLHAAVVEIVAQKDARVDYSTVQNWFPGDENGNGGVYNFVTKRGECRGDNSFISWTQIETGSAITWKYPSVILRGDNSIGEFRSVALTNHHQQADTGTKMIHLGKNTKSTIVSKSISAGQSTSTYRGLVRISKKAENARNYTQCDSLLFGEAKVYTIPTIENNNFDSTVEHEASTSKISEDELNYLLQRGLDEEAAKNLIVNGFCKEIFQKLPAEFAVEARKLLEVNLEGSLG
jgi:Fe-S cluster assembly scaffold protein SufB